MPAEQQPAAAAPTFTASVEECTAVRTGIMQRGLDAAYNRADKAELDAWLVMLEIACRLVDDAQARG